jgi:predicted nucleic acid-binding protein
MVVADTGAIVALVDRTDRHHKILRKAFERRPAEWLLPWAILPEVDYLLGAHVGRAAQDAFLEDVADGTYEIEWGRPVDLDAARRLHTQYSAVRLGLVDAVVIAVAIRHRASAIATLDLRHFAAIEIPGAPGFWPRDL